MTSSVQIGSDRKRLLMIAFQFPPFAGSSGVQRTLRFAQYLPEFGWQPLILTAHPRAYERISTDQIEDIGMDTPVERAPAFDAARHFSIYGRYPRLLARPDRWMSWFPGAVWTGWRMIRSYRPSLLWSTYPIATAHWVGARLQRLSGLPWVADFRDPMAQEGYPADPAIWRSFKKIESRTLDRARLCVFTTPGAQRDYARRYPKAAECLALLENGYDESAFASVISDQVPLNPGCITILHSGVVYPSERDPTALFQALRRLVDSGRLGGCAIRLRFRASGHDDLLRTLTTQYRLSEVVEILPVIAYRDALDEMRRADRLLIMQAANCNDQIPAKLYEYARAQRPVIGLTDPMGDTAWALRNFGMHDIASLDDSNAIIDVLAHSLAQQPLSIVDPNPSMIVKSASRRERTRQLANYLDTIVGSSRNAGHDPN